MRSIIFLFCLSFLLVNCERKHYSLTPIGQEEFKEIYKSDKKIQLVDARTQTEYDQGFIEGAILIDIRKNDFLDQANSKLNTQDPIYIYCKMGSRSVKAGTELLLSKKFPEVYYIKGGYTQWKQNQE